MDRLSDEANYVITNLLRMQQEVAAHPELFEPDALERLAKAVASVEEVRPKAA